MVSTLISVLIQVAIALVTYIVLGAIVEAMARRGYDPIGRLAAVISPDPAPVGGAEEEAP